MDIKTAKDNDLPAIRRISSEHNFETDRDWKELLQSKNKDIFLIKEDDRIMGFSGLIYHTWNNTIQITNVFILPEYRRKGLARQMIEHNIKEAKKTDFRCLIAEAPSLNPVLKIYKKLGFRKCGYNDRYYSNTGREICIWMSLDLK